MAAIWTPLRGPYPGSPADTPVGRRDRPMRSGGPQAEASLMFTDFSQLIAQSELHRKELLADADNHRLVKLATSLRRQAARAASRDTPPPTDPPEPRRVDGSADSNSRGERRYAVSR
jgi:hypothetical protein